MNSLREDWAFTRYDVLGHGQGGVLARMLSSADPPAELSSFGLPAVRPFRSLENLNRGKFHRIVTIGAPHNGSRWLHYVNKLFAIGLPVKPDFIKLMNLQNYGSGDSSVRLKWDPLGEDIQSLNDSGGTENWIPDKNALFHLYRTTINNGIPKSNLNGLLVDSSYVGKEGGAIVLPSGYDAIVDVDSMVAHFPGETRDFNVSSLPESENVSHHGRRKC